MLTEVSNRVSNIISRGMHCLKLHLIWFWIVGYILLLTIIWSKMCFIRENIIQINSNVPNQSIVKQQHGYLFVQKGSPIRYSSEEPKVDHDNKYKILSSNVCKIIRNLRINRRQT